MTTLNINGRRVKVGDEFRNLSPEQQQATVDEIARELGMMGDADLPADQAAPDENDSWGSLLATLGQKVDPETNQPHGVPEFQPVGVEGYDPRTGEVTRPEPGAIDRWSDRVGAFVTGAGDLPIVGPAVKSGSAAIAAGVTAPFAGDMFAERYQGMRDRQEQVMEENPGYAMAGNLAGAVGAMAPIGATAMGARALGITGNSLLGRMGASGLTSAAISGADTAVRGGDLEQVAGSAAIGGGIGAAIPGLGRVVESGWRAVGDKAAPILNAIRDPALEAQRRVGSSIQRDIAANPAAILSSADEAIARQSGMPLINVDRGGETTRALARSVANQSPEARAIIENVANDRFAGQAPRAVEFVRRIAGGSADDLAFQQLIKDTARAVNRPAYNKAYTSPAAQNMWHEGFEQLMQTPAMQTAARQATGRGANRAAVEGFTPVRNPFTFDQATGRMTLARNADGSVARPTLQFWDQVKRNLDGIIGKAERGGDRTYAGDIKALKSHLVGMLDDAVPDYRTARQGAAGFFDAEDALEAGRKFANSPRSIPEAKAAFSKFNRTERAGFQAGYASELIDRIKASGDRTNVINSVFKSPASRESMEMVFGPQKMKEIEAFVRVEDIVDRLRGAMGNSTTARQLVEMGIGAMGGATVTGDWSGAAMGALAVKGGRAALSAADNRVMIQMAQLLTKDSPQTVLSAVKLAQRNPAYMQALERLSAVLTLPARAGAITTGASASVE